MPHYYPKTKTNLKTKKKLQEKNLYWTFFISPFGHMGSVAH